MLAVSPSPLTKRVASMFFGAPEDDPFAQQKALLGQLGSPEQAMSAVMSARGENPGETAHPLLAGRSPEELGILDRLASARVARKNVGLPMAIASGLFGVAPYEAVKAIAQRAPAAGSLITGATRLLHPAATEEYGLGATTSPASLANVLSYFAGLRQ